MRLPSGSEVSFSRGVTDAPSAEGRVELSSLQFLSKRGATARSSSKVWLALFLHVQSLCRSTGVGFAGA